MLNTLGLALVSHVMVATANGPNKVQHVSYPSSDLIGVAQLASSVWERGRLNPSSIFYDILDPKLDKLPGFQTVIYYKNDKPLLAISTLLSTGQVVDKNRCIIFLSPEIARFGESVRKLTGASVVSRKSLGETIGCENLKEIGMFR